MPSIDIDSLTRGFDLDHPGAIDRLFKRPFFYALFASEKAPPNVVAVTGPQLFEDAQAFPQHTTLLTPWDVNMSSAEIIVEAIFMEEEMNKEEAKELEALLYPS